MWTGAPSPKDARQVAIEGASGPGLVVSDGLLIPGTDGKAACVKFLSVGGKYMQAAKYGLQGGGDEKLVLTDEEEKVVLRECERASPIATHFLLPRLRTSRSVKASARCGPPS